MSLMRLLTVSRSFVIGQSQMGRYRMVGRHGGLPQFGPTGHAVHSAVARSPARSLSACPSELPKVVSCNDQTPVQPTKPTGISVAKSAKSPFVKPDCLEPKADHEPAERVGPARKAISSLRGWFRSRSKPRFRSPFVGKTLRPPVQVHLALESVQVVRNDLSDSDFEVRAVGATRAARALEKPALEKLKRGLAGMSWSQVTTRLFENGRARAQTR